MGRRFLVVDLGGTHVRTAVAQETGQLVARLDEPTKSGPPAVIRQITAMAEESCRRSGIGRDEIERIVVATPGPLDRNAGVVFDAPNLAGWEHVPLRAELERALDLPVTLENDANAAGFGEFMFGAARGTKHAVYFTVSTGIGGGIVNDGRILEGESGLAGEMGHMTIDRNGPRCNCGNNGCLEALASGTAIARRFAEALDRGERSRMAEELGHLPTAVDVVRAAQEGDELARRVFLDAADALGVGVVNAIHLFNPNIVVIGGGVTKAGDLLFDTVREVVNRRALPRLRGSARIVPAELGEDVGLIGALAVGLCFGE